MYRAVPLCLIKCPNLEFLRQQVKKAAGQSNDSLADFIQPSGINEKAQDFIGAFSVTIQGIEPHIRSFETAQDDYNKIMLQALADRLAEAFAEYLHEKVTGRLEGRNCHGEEKVRRLREHYNLASMEYIYAYGDSEGDRPLQAVAHEFHYRSFK